MILTQQYLQDHSCADLRREHAVGATLSACRRKASLNYNMIEARDDDPVACQCRGLVIAKADGTEIDPAAPLGDTLVLARPPDRFFNFGQGAAAPIDFTAPSTVFMEKRDGTAAILHHDPFQQQWHVATRSVPEADRPVDGFAEYTFRTLFEKCLLDTLVAGGALPPPDASGDEAARAREAYHRFCGRLDPEVTHFLEITSPVNHLVVDYRDFRVTLLALRVTATGEELDPYVHPVPGVPTVRLYRLGSVADMLAFVNARSGLEFEGVVVRDARFRRVKVKNADYLARHALIGGLVGSPRALLAVILRGQDDDVLPMLPPHLREKGEAYRQRYREMVRRYDDAYPRLLAETQGDANPRKAMALAVQREGLRVAPMMVRWSGKCEDFEGFVMSNQKDGAWPDSFLDGLLQTAGIGPEAPEETR
jgi:hypothetical protein